MAAIKHLFHIATPREKVYKAISTIDGLANWWTKETSGESKVGGVIEFRFGSHGVTKMKVKELKENDSVVWQCVDSNPDWDGTVLTFKLGDNDGKTRVRFSHDGWKETGDFYAACSFSWGRYLESLRQLCQAGKGEAFDSENYRK